MIIEFNVSFEIKILLDKINIVFLQRFFILLVFVEVDERLKIYAEKYFNIFVVNVIFYDDL